MVMVVLLSRARRASLSTAGHADRPRKFAPTPNLRSRLPPSLPPTTNSRYVHPHVALP